MVNVCGMVNFMKDKIHRFKCLIFKVTVLFTQDRQLADSYAKKWGYEIDGTCKGYFIHDEKEKQALIWCKDINKSIQHETYHLICWILDNRGISMDKGTEELRAYYHEYWTNKIKKAIK